MIVILGYSVLTLVYDSKIIIGYFEYKEERGFFGADGYKILDKPVYKYENLGFYVLIFGNIIFWLFLLIKKRYEEFKFSVKIFPLIFAIIYFMVLDFPQRHRDTLQEVNHLPKLRER